MHFFKTVVVIKVFSLVEVSVTPRNFYNSLVVMVFLFLTVPSHFSLIFYLN